ncbi:DUF4097 family beta strand repeat-containing protein [Microtetraspora glauca]|uniref:DUF4097 family beta strand repeat-containing protein n=1 Tax=Microtetraspora glauca TaxID=1996 RepID=A0ABV3GKF3_MICGL
MTTSRSLVLTASALVLLAGCGVSADEAQPEKRSFAFAQDRLSIAKGSGDLDIKPGEVADVQVRRWFSRWSVLGGDPKTTWDLKDGTLTLATDCVTLIGGCDVRYEVVVPAGTALTVEGDNGRVSASGFGAGLRIRTDNGAISVADASGPLSLESENGEVRATGTRSGQVDAVSGNGAIHLAFAAVPDQVAVRTDNGALTVEVPDAAYQVKVKGGKDVRADVREDATSRHVITATSDNGRITVRPAGPAS